MPIFEFKCNECGNSFETLVIGQDIPKCPSCSGTDLSKMISKCGFVTKSSSIGDNSGQINNNPSTSSSACSGCSATNCASCSSK